ncbi:basement membrane-specific heparan sulfate proteoglycan core protein isoform X4 [Eurosta solidaginis]|uniref:basement membrane-specific heparan sulfate proteoglycan core protein isoform X4 n=1 Tax=Eurosta solidaginis TaxID=178769 RepID=UPI003531634C
MGSVAPHRGERARRAIFRVTAVLLILHATCGTYHMATAKDLSNADLSIDDTFDIDQFDETPAVSVAAAALSRSKRNLDSNLLLEEDLQPFEAEDDTDANNSSWLSQGVKRVRRELSRLFGKDDEEAATAKQSPRHKRNHSAGEAKQQSSQRKHHNKQPKHKTQSIDGKKQRTKQQLHNKHRPHLLLQRQKSTANEEKTGAEHANKHLKKLAKKHTKRQSDFEGSGDGDGDEIFEEAPTTLWRTHFVINEPWNDAFADSKSNEFLEIHRELEIAFRDLFHELHNDEDLDVGVTLLAIARSNDIFKIYATVQLELPEEVNDFEQDFVNHINSFHRLGNLGVEVGDQFYFRNARDTNGNDYDDGNAGIDEGVNEHPDATPNYQYDCDRNPNGEFQCSDGSSIQCSDVCNRYPDCADSSDEDVDMCQPIFDEEDRQERKRAEEEQRRQAEEEEAEAEARRRAEEEDKALQLAEREEEERRRAEERAYEEAERRRVEQEREEEERRVEAGENPVTTQPNADDDDELLHAEQQEEERRNAAHESEVQRRQEEYEAEERRRAEFDRDPLEQPNESEAPIQPAQPDATEEPQGVSHNKGFDEGSGDDFHYISTDRSTLFTPTVGCRGDTSFTCSESGMQVCDEQRCDGREDCPDGEDELECPGDDNEGNNGYDLEEGYEKVCAEYEFKCDERCLPREFLCNGKRECLDGLDEANCPTTAPKECQANEYRCRSGDCIDNSRRCDHVPDCPDGDDEDSSCLIACRDDEYLCRDGQRCISNSKICDRINDCVDADDEDQCEGSGEPECKYNEFKCDNDQCIPMRELCDNIYDCVDYSDEKNCAGEDIGRNIFDDNEIIREYAQHERKPATIEGPLLESLDSKEYLPWHFYQKSNAINRCTESQFKCGTNVCIPLKLRCDGFYHCNDMTDERDCEQYNAEKRRTIAPPAQLERTTQAAQRIPWWRTTAPTTTTTTTPTPITAGWSTTIAWTGIFKTPVKPRYNNTCLENLEFTCQNGDCIPFESVCDGTADCTRREDEDYNLCNCSSDKWKCLRGGGCIPKTQVCDGKRQCKDGSDESICRCAANQFRCNNGDCISDSAHCNGYRDCRDGSDEEDCSDPTYEVGRSCLTSQFRCNNGQCINAAARCNGYTDCSDSSDELSCRLPDTSSPNPQLNLKTYPPSQIIKESREVIFRCRDEGPVRARVKWTRPGGRPLPIGARDNGDGRLEIPNIRVEDSGQYICEATGYPRHVPGQQVTVHLTVEKTNPTMDRPPTACRANQATCRNSECIDKSQICDGIPHCSDGSDEESCSHGLKCQPNQFMCRNSRCIDRIWRCDGEDDCFDNSDEDSCDPEPSGAPCRYDEFQCRSGHCIPKNFQCDDTNDCIDGTDEIGCMAPAPIRPPPPHVRLPQGEPLNLTCVGTGVPVPLIVWRLNWGHVPEKCVSKSYAGTGTLYCPNMDIQDQGAYSCEILNSKGRNFVTPDTQVTIDTPSRPDVCPAGFFNMLARRPDDCINCFCFGISKTCRSANLFTFAIQPPITSHKVKNVELNPYSDIIINDVPQPNILSRHHGVQFRVSDVGYNGREQPYLALPVEYMGNQLKSYGGYLRYDVNFLGNGRTNQAPDVIITGNGFTLTHRTRNQPEPNINNKVSVQFGAGNWYKTDGRRATREEIMMVLANVDNILIRLSYIDATEREVELTNIVMDSAALDDQGLGSASLVEKCTCPPGYSGDSCESCKPGYVREKYGPWLGRCVPFVPKPCQPGTYGDPGRGIPCRQCPCPQTGANNYASGCQLSPDGDVTCNCYEGYTGRRCELCAPGYQGNPLIPGGSCHRIPESTCNAEGTYYPHPNGTCECKPLVVGPRCDTCAPESFHLNAFTFTGCIECFCSGLTKQCSSSSWYRDQVSSNFGRSRAPHGFNLIRDYETSQPSQVSFQLSNSALQFSQQSTSDPLYWSLPAPFLGDKITAYGGKLSYNLSYNPLPGGLMSRNNAPDVVIKSGEDLTIIHYRKAGVNPNQPSSYYVPMIESSWQRSDGQVVNREHLLMALSKIDAIYIKATYTTSTKDGQLTQVSLDTATQNNIGTQRAYEVEECRCPAGYIGLSCERCAPGYKRDTEAGLYLGICEPCECNGHSNQCDAETGVCMNCAHNTAGEFCERCAPGYAGNASGGTPYDCTPDTGTGIPSPYPPPSPGNQTQCSYCNRDGTVSCDGGYCACKANVVGPYCDQCREGTFGLSARNPDGCEECYCSGQSTTCHSASLYRQLIPVDFISTRPLLTDDEGNIADTENLVFDLPSNKYTYNHHSYTPKYWSLRGSVLGNQLYSYGGHLSYTLDVDSYGHYEPGNDVILIGNGMKLLWSRPIEEQENNEYRVRLHEDGSWQRLERGHSVRASRLDFMGVLSNLEHILIRATPKIPTQRTSIRDVILESAVEHRTPDAQQAVEVEICSCPDNYAGNSCEKCANLYYKDNYGRCEKCPCREDTSVGCSLQNNGEVNCQCRPGYSGQQCQIDDDYDRPQPPTTPTPLPPPDYQTQITVSIAPPEITIIPVGSSLTLSCTGRMAWSGMPVFVSWSKQNGRLPYGAEDDGGVLRLYDLHVYDSGVYICRAVNNQTQRVFEDQISITITEDSQRTPSEIINLPQVVTFEEYQPNEIHCVASGYPIPTVTWTRVDGQMSREAHTDGSRLIFDAPRKSDEGRYRCQASNEIGIDEKYTQVYVRIAPPQPPPPPRELVYIEPPSYTGQSGENVRLTCQPTTSIMLVYEWNKDGYPLYRQRNIIISGNTIEIRESTPRDSGVYTCIGIDQRGRRNYTNDAQVVIEDSSYPMPGPGQQPGNIPPVVKPLPEENHILQGQDFSLTCEATGSPYPSIKWTKVHEALPNNVQQTGSVLRIINARPENRGMYLCIAENVAGSHESNTIIDVEPRESPTIDIHPPEPQTVNVGTEAMLYCSATGIPEPTVQWRRVDGKPLSARCKEVNSNAGYIIIADIQVEDAGDYECVAQNAVGRVTAVQQVRVLVPPVITLEPSDEVLSLTEGDELKVVCSASGTPNPTVQWVNDSAETRAVLPGSPQYSKAYLEKYRVDRNDAKSYKCIASNEAGTAESYVTVDVRPRRGDAPDDSDVIRNPQYPYIYPPPSQQTQYPPARQPSYGPPQNVYRANEGDAVTLTCDLNNVPNVSTRWERVDGRPLPDNSYYDRNSLIITRVEEQNSGQYRCNAFDNRGTVVTFVIAELVLVPIPHITFHPKMPIVVAPNDNIDIYCEVTGEQPIDVSWHTDNNRPLTDSVRIDGQYLRFVSITPADAGRYYCSASNRYGNTTNMAEVVVNRNGAYQPAPREQVYKIREGEDVTLQCDVQSVREPIRGEIRYEWRRQDNHPLPRNALIRDQRLYLRGVLKQDEGRYVCESYTTGGGRSAPSYVDLTITRGYSINEVPCVVFYICTDVKPAKALASKPPTRVSYDCQPSDFKCVSHPHTCIRASMVCDGIHDCTDHSDEFNCTPPQPQLPPPTQKSSTQAPASSVAPKPTPLSAPTAQKSAHKPNYKRWKKRHSNHKERHSDHTRTHKHKQLLRLKTRRHLLPTPFFGSIAVPPLRQFPQQYATLPPAPQTRPRDLSLKLDQQSSQLRLGESTEVECYSSDSSYTDVVWERADGSPLPPHIQQIGNRLIISHVTASDAGNYVCKCKTDEGDLYTTSYELGIEEWPHEWKRPKLVHANVGSTAELNCDAEVPGSYRWIRQYGQMQANRDLFNERLELQNVQSSDAGTYICTASTPDGQTVDYPTILVVTGAIPQFHQDPVSYMSFPTLPESYIKFNFDITFRPEQGNGLLLFNGQKRGSGDYISLSLNDRYPEFRFDFDGKPMVIRAERPISLNEWHTVRVNRFRRDGYMQVDDQHPVAFPTLAQISPLDLIEDLYIGGVPNWEMLPEDAVDEQVGFVGCISRLTLQGTIVELMKEAKLKEGVTACRPCQKNPCENGGICLESQTEMAYTCICQQGWTGQNCGVEGTQCTPGICGSGRCENTETGMECLCPLNKTGDRCQYIEHLNENSLAFKLNSYAAYHTPRASKLNIKFKVRPNSLNDALLLYAAESKLAGGDFIAVLLHDKHVEFIINTGARLNPLLVRSQNPLPVNKWTEIEVSRRFGEGILRVGNEPEQRAKAAKLARMLYIKTPLYIGGYDHENIKLNRDVNVTQGFDGCISALFEGPRQINLIADIHDAANIQNCGEINEIEQNESFDNYEQEATSPNRLSDTTSKTQNGDACASDPCENGSTCSVQDGEAICTCTVGFTGKYCEDHITIEYDANFHGNGYLEIDRNQFNSDIEQKYSFAAMVFSTTDANGLLLWWGQKKDEEYKGQDFMALAIVDGTIEFSFRLNGEETVIRNPDKRIDDGRRHIVLIKRTDNTAILELDHLLDAGETRPTGKDKMNLPGHVFIGGTPNTAKFTGGRYTKNFNGCVRVVEGDARGIIQLGTSAISGANVDTCPQTEDDPLGTEPPVV